MKKILLVILKGVVLLVGLFFLWDQIFWGGLVRGMTWNGFGYKDFPPGCLEFDSPIFGGCFGKSIIHDFKMEPQIDCLEMRVNNCNGGQIELVNRCREDIRIGNMVIPYIKKSSYQDYCVVKLVKGRNGETVVYKLNDEKRSGMEANNLTESLRGINDKGIETEGRVGSKRFVIKIDQAEQVEIEPTIECLEVGKITFAGTAAIMVYNRCEERVEIGGVNIDPYNRIREEKESYWGIELARDGAGEVVVRETDGNFASYTPKKNDRLKVKGEVKGKDFEISYLKSKKMCD